MDKYRSQLGLYTWTTQSRPWALHPLEPWTTSLRSAKSVSLDLILHVLDLDAVASGKDYPDLWVHVDAAWAGVALSCEELREKLYLDAINGFVHSFCTNFHKVSNLILKLST